MTHYPESHKNPGCALIIASCSGADKGVNRYNMIEPVKASRESDVRYR